ncbi:MAG: chorismate-binding protein, partial [Chitinispirillaceae bacterium]|nr:chorismate-binding protein [Chitinispirillaceae bacterium]
MLHPLPIDLLAPLVRQQRQCVLLDNAFPGREQRYSYFFMKAGRIIKCAALHDVGPALEEVSREAQRHWVAGYLTYEAAYGLEEKFSSLVPGSTSFPQDLLWFGMFDEPYIFDHVAGTWNRSPYDGAPMLERGRKPKTAETPHVHLTINNATYERSLEKIKALIAAGDVYQVNFTYDVQVKTGLDSWDFYRRLREEQPVPFCAFIKTGRMTIASLSPELFFMQKGPHLYVRPMKGTAPRGRHTGEDRKIARALSIDPKNRSENVMIVDLLRNDLGRICRTGSIRVERLFEVERHPTLHQMTSTIRGRLRASANLYELLSALFPSGSVTGAPKIRAMEIIHHLERGLRGVYCGA